MGTTAFSYDAQAATDVQINVIVVPVVQMEQSSRRMQLRQKLMWLAKCPCSGGEAATKDDNILTDVCVDSLVASTPENIR